MACTYTFKGTIYSEAEFNQMLSDNPNLKDEYLGGNLDVNKSEFDEDRLVLTKPTLAMNEIQYVLKAVDILSSDKAKQVFDKGNKNKWSIDKILTELAIPKDQKELILALGSTEREDIIMNLGRNYSFIVKIDTAVHYPSEKYINLGDGNYDIVPNEDVIEEDIDIDFDDEGNPVNYTTKYKVIKERESKPTAHYANLTVPGGTNYTENEIYVPGIVPSIKGHAQFSTANGIGWFRSDEQFITSKEYPLSFKGNYGDIWEKRDNIWYTIDSDGITHKRDDLTDTDVYAIYDNQYGDKNYIQKGENTKTRRILEVQSDLFQKWRNNFEFESDKYTATKDDKNVWYYYKNSNEISDNEYTKIWKTFLDIYLDNADAFTKLLQKDNNWVTFFIKSIIQDSAKKGYEKVLFPKGETAAKVEGHETIAEEIRKIDNNLNMLGTIVNEGKTLIITDKKQISKDIFDNEIYTKTDVLKYKSEIQQAKERLEQEKANLKSQGIEKLKPIEAFYEIKVTNVLNKHYKDNLAQITDEYGNPWNKITITPEMLNDIQLSSFASLTNPNEQKVVKDAHKFIQARLADFANRVKAFPKDATTQDMVDILTQQQINTDLSIIDLDNIAVALDQEYKYSAYHLHNRNGILAKLRNYSNLDIKTLVEDDNLRKEFTDTMRTINIFLRSFNRINELKSETDTTGWEDIADTLNTLVKAHQTLLVDINNAKKMYDDLIYNFFMERNNSISTNPNIQQGIMDIFTATDDESGKQLWLDAMADTNNSFIATTIKNYVRQMAIAEDEYNIEIQKFRNAIKDAFGLASVDEISKLTVASFDKYLEKDSVGRTTGKFVQQYKYDEYYAAMNAFMSSIRTRKGTPGYYDAIAQWHKDNDVVDLTQDEIDDIIANKKIELSTNQFTAWYAKNVFVNRVNGEITYKVSGELARPADKYLNDAWVNLQTDAFFKYVTDLLPKLIKPYIGSNIVAEGFVPARTPSDKPFSFTEYYERHLAKKANEFLGENNELIRVLDLPMINRLDQVPLIPISEKFGHETWDMYTFRVIMETENGGYGKYDSIAEIQDENKKRQEDNRVRHGQAFDKDLYGVISKFIKVATDYKYKKAIESEVTLALYKADDLKFAQRDHTGKRKVNTVANRMLNRGNKGADVTLPNSNVKQHFTQWMEAIFYENFDIDQGNLTAISKILLKYVSAKNMWLNYTAGINNVVYGNLQIKIEKAAAYFVTANDLHEADKEYWSNVVHMIADLRRETSDNMTVAILKRMDIVESQTEKEVGAKSVWKHLISTDSLYFMQEMGEHWMQNKMLLAMMKSHRVVDGKIKSFQDFKSDADKKVLDTILTPRELDKLNTYVSMKADAEQYIDSKHDYIQEFLYKYIDATKLREYNKLRKENDVILRTEFETYTTVQDSFELVNGVANIKKTTVGGVETAVIDNLQFGDFIQRVKKVNQKLHGIYNKDDASMFQRTATGKLAMQFRKWMVPGWNKRFGSKFFKSYWTEGRQDWDKGSYVSFGNFLLTPITKGLSGNIDDMQITGRAMGNMISDIYKFLRNLKLYYNVLDDFEKANVQRTVKEISFLFLTLAIGFASRMIGKDDDDKKYPFLVDLYFYQVDRMASELGFYTPIGWVNEGQKILRSPAAAISAITDAGTTIANSFMFLVDSDGRYYKGGVYNRELKLHVSTAKMIPVYNQWFKGKRIDKMNRYYNLFFF